MPTDDSRELYAAHPRGFEANHYVYPVLSRRARGISIGVNLNLDKICNFNCVYCQVDRSQTTEKEFVDLQRLEAELDATVDLVASGKIFQGPRFAKTPPELRRLNDIALSGDGEPTTYRNFDEVVRVSAEVRRRHGLDEVKLILITNASLLDRDRVRQALELLDANGGEIWAKLDAGTEAYFAQVARSPIPFSRILDNLRETAQRRPIVIQSLFMRMHDESPSETEREAYCRRLADIVAAGGRIKEVQIHTVARPPAESWVAALTRAEVDAIAEMVRQRTGLVVATFYAPE